MRFRQLLYKLTHWEQWHYDVKYIPLYPCWLWYCLRNRSLWFLSASNPVLPFGGWDGESKWKMYEQLPKEFYPKTVRIQKGTSLSDAELQLREFSFPVAVKPDAGLMGLLFRKLDSLEQWRDYHRSIPIDYLIQELVTDPLEVSVFYYRFPGQQNGTITGFVYKEGLEVRGDGISDLDTLLQQLVNRPGFKLDEWRLKHKDHLQEVIPKGAVFKLAWVANLSRGGRLVSLEKEKDSRLLQWFDRISHHAQFFYGRYDIKCSSVEALKNGQFRILEFNGAGAEPHHIYGNGNNLLQAYRIVLQHWHAMAEIARIHHCNGVPYWPFRQGLERIAQAKKQLKLLKTLDRKILV
jgi:hypothetical protein